MNENQYYEKGGSTEKPIVGASIASQLQPDSQLEKLDLLGSQVMSQTIQQCNVTVDMAQKLARGGRDNLHLLRMLRRSEAERNFSLAYLRHRDDIFAEDQESANIIVDVIGTEGADTKMFWTFAPYLFKALTEKGVPERESIRKILSWSKNGVTTGTESIKPFNENSRDWNKLHLLGLEKHDREVGGCWVLSEDPKHISHKYTEQEARYIADLLIG